MNMPIDLAWAAGFIDGEGCFHVRDYTSKAVVTMSITQVDRRPLDRLARVIGGVVVKGPRNHSKSPNSQGYHWIRFQGKKLDRFFAEIQPYLSEPKREQYTRCKERVEERAA